MDGEFLTETKPSEHLSYTEQFERAVPYYMSIGMTPDEFWKGEPLLAKWYRESFRMKRDMMNEQRWLQGMYIYDALCDAAPLFRSFTKRGTRASPYPKEPYQLHYRGESKDESKEANIENKVKMKMDSLMAHINSKFEKGGMTDANSNRSAKHRDNK